MMLPGFESELDRRAAEPDTAEREDSPTPRPLVRAILAEAMPVVVANLDEKWGIDIDAVDVCAGYGVFASELRRWCAVSHLEPHITGVEICEARRVHGVKWCDAWAACDWTDFFLSRPELGVVFDLALGNPHFTALVSDDGPHASMPAVLLQRAHAVLLYHTCNAFQRSRPGRDVWRAYPPAVTWLVPGTVSHDGTSSVASDCYQATLWLRDHRGPTEARLLDAEPTEANAAAGLLKSNGEPYACWRWRNEPPGSEQPSADLPAAPGWTP